MQLSGSQSDPVYIDGVLPSTKYFHAAISFHPRLWNHEAGSWDRGLRTGQLRLRETEAKNQPGTKDFLIPAFPLS